MTPRKIALAAATAASLAAAPVLAREGSGGPAGLPDRAGAANATGAGPAAPAVPNYENAASGGAMTRGAAIGGFSGAAAGTVGGGPGIGLPSPSGAPPR